MFTPFQLLGKWVDDITEVDKYTCSQPIGEVGRNVVEPGNVEKFELRNDGFGLQFCFGDKGVDDGEICLVVVYVLVNPGSPESGVDVSS